MTNTALIAAAQAVVDRWDTPAWKDVEHTAVFINRLRAALTAAAGVVKESLTAAHEQPPGIARDDTVHGEMYYAAAQVRAVLAQAAPAPADSGAAPAGGVDWQDISTAPKDGTRFVAVGQNYGLDSEAQHTCIAQWLAGCWVEVSDWNGASKLKYLTHWMPLPPLPCSAARTPAEIVGRDAAFEADHIDFARAVLAEWGTPAPVGVEPAQWQKRHQLRTNGEWENTNEHDAKWWRDNSQGWEIRALYTTPQPTQAKAGAVPLTCEWTHNDDDSSWDTECGQSWRFDDGGPKENHMNFCHCCGKTLRIKGGQHGADT